MIRIAGTVDCFILLPPTEDIVQARPDDRWETWASGFINQERWIRTVYNGYSGRS